MENENDLLLGSHKRRFFSYEQRANKTVLRVAVERDLSLKHNYQTQIDLWQMVCLTLKKVLNIEFPGRLSCYILKSNFSFARPDKRIKLARARLLTFS